MLLQSETPALDDRIFEPYGVRAAGWISLSGCQPNRVQLNQQFEWTEWSCVFLNKGDPVHEERSAVENIPPRGRAIQRSIQDYGGPFDKIECRFMRSRPRRKS